MRYLFVLILLVVHTTLCQKITKKVRRSVTGAAGPMYNTTCKNIECAGEPDPMCVKLKYDKSDWPEVGDKTVYVVMFNRCEMQYVNCHKGIKAIEMPMKNCEHGVHKKSSKKRDLGKDQKSRSKRDVAEAPLDPFFLKKGKAPKKRSLLQKTKGRVLKNKVRRVLRKMMQPHKRSKRQVRTDDEGANQLSDGEEPMRRYHDVVKHSEGQTYASIGNIKDNLSPKRTRPEVYQISKGDNNSKQKPMFGKQLLADKSNNMKLKDTNGNDGHLFKNPIFSQQNKKLKGSQAKKPMLGDRMFATNSVKQLKNYERNHQGNEKLNNRGENGQVTGEPMFREPMFAANANHKLKQSPRQPMFAAPMFAKNKNYERNHQGNEKLNNKGENGQVTGEPMFREPMFAANANHKLKQSPRQPMFAAPMFAKNKNIERNNQGKEKLNNKRGNGEPMFRKPMFASNANHKLRQNPRKPMFAAPMFAKKKNPQHGESDQGENEQASGEPMLRKPIAHRGKHRANRASKNPIIRHRVLANSKKLRGSNRGKPMLRNKKLGKKKDLRADDDEGKPMGPSMQQAFLDPNYNGNLQPVPAKVNGKQDGVADGDGDLEGVEGEGQDFEQPLLPSGKHILPGVIVPAKVNGKEDGVADGDGDLEGVEGEGQDFEQPLLPSGKHILPGVIVPAKVNGKEDGVADGDGDLEGVEGEGQDFEQPLLPSGKHILPGVIDKDNKEENGDAVAGGDEDCEEEDGDGKAPKVNGEEGGGADGGEEGGVADGDGVADGEEDSEDVEGEGQDFDQPLLPTNPEDKNGKQNGNTEIFNPIAQNRDVVQDDEVIEEGTGQEPGDEDEDEQEVATATEAVDKEQYKADCPTVCPARDVMLCARCTHGVYRTFMSVCHMRMFNCKQPDEKLELVSREPCVMSAPYLNDLRVPKGGVSEPHDVDDVLRYFKCKVQRGIKKSSKCEFSGRDSQTKLDSK